MTTGHLRAPDGVARPPGPRDPRLIVRDEPMNLAAHRKHYGPVPLLAAGSDALITEVERAGLTGRGGAAFSTGRKLRAVATANAGRGARVVVANGSESEPASSKDAVLLARSPHLVLDGIQLCAAAVGASRGYLCLGSRSPAARSVREAFAERDRAGLGGVPIEVVDAAADGYLAGQETALVSLLNGGRAVPAFVPPRPSDKGVRRQPTLVLNVETLAQVALIARYGATWFRSVGADDAPGSALVTVTGGVSRPGVREIPLGTPLGEVLRRSGLAAPAQAVLTGGYFGTWLPLPDAFRVPMSAPGLRAAGATFGAGVLAVLPASSCGLAETARVAGYLASQIADQCGPCRNGMPALAEAMNWIAFGRPDADIIGWARQLTGLITGRGACHLPDGAAVLARSALAVFSADLRAHATAGPCGRAQVAATLPIPPRSHR
ncbi:MAG TPA: NADH-ubiquinone oxidoreductase-F iron-sulfur binding region domain-containing protein [Streptosporangiaceae bacterium]|nr:NADH-ubiquinone oxidoreductase-F iron-sulfur binding region domain-containing protein [Streptosporangiaceae bacterium]